MNRIAKPRVLWCFLGIGVLVIGLYMSSWRPILPGYHAFYYTSAKYSRLKQSLQTRQKELSQLYHTANTKEEKEQLLKQASAQLIGGAKKQFVFWYGTRWGFNGITQIPGDGSIACGYFVTTVLRDAGVKLNRVALAKAASEAMIRKLTTEQHIRRFSHIPLETFVKDITNIGEGLYVVGLDNHTGFLLCEGKQVWFIHSSGMPPFCVVKEKALGSGILSKSAYRVVGHLSGDKQFMQDWLLAGSPEAQPLVIQNP